MTPMRNLQTTNDSPVTKDWEFGWKVRPLESIYLQRDSLNEILYNMLNYSEPIHRVFHALADPTRLEMFEQLCGGPASVSELAKELPVSLPAVLQHLAVLEADGIVHSEKVGRVRTCRIEPAVLQKTNNWVAERRAMWERSLDRLGDFLAEGSD